jgi:hypothetical protein
MDSSCSYSDSNGSVPITGWNGFGGLVRGHFSCRYTLDINGYARTINMYNNTFDSFIFPRLIEDIVWSKGTDGGFPLTLA